MGDQRSVLQLPIDGGLICLRGLSPRRTRFEVEYALERGSWFWGAWCLITKSVCLERYFDATLCNGTAPSALTASERQLLVTALGKLCP